MSRRLRLADDTWNAERIGTAVLECLPDGTVKQCQVWVAGTGRTTYTGRTAAAFARFWERCRADWQACTDPPAMLNYLYGRMSARKQQLFDCGCCRLCWQLFRDERSRQAVEVAERYADGQAGRRELTAARQAARAAWRAGDRYASLAVYATGYRDEEYYFHDHCRTQVKAHAALLRDLFGNPFRPVGQYVPCPKCHGVGHFDVPDKLDAYRVCSRCATGKGSRCMVNPAWLTWHAGTVAQMARAIYERHAFDQLPVLADALEEAGCADPDLLAHCRRPGRHFRGCCVVDCLLGKV
jgi:hypothetical protein